MLKGPPSDKQQDDSIKARLRVRKLLSDEMEKMPPPADDAPPGKSPREQKAQDWRKDLYDAE